MHPLGGRAHSTQQGAFHRIRPKSHPLVPAGPLLEFQHNGGPEVGRSAPAARNGKCEKPAVFRFEIGQLP
jgi:hypothetical protein